MDRIDALKLLKKHIKNSNLQKHAFAVESAMRAYARKFNEDEHKWALVGLLHDIDYEKHPSPEEHGLVGAAILEKEGFTEEMVYAVKSHADHPDIERRRLMDRVLYAVDEMTGFLVACALVQPSKKLADVKVSSVKKKMKSKSFAKGVSRDGLKHGAEDIGIDFDEHIQFVKNSMLTIAEELGLS